MFLINHIKAGRKGIYDQINLPGAQPNDRNAIIGFLNGLSGIYDGKRRLKVDDWNNPERRHTASRSILEAFCEKYDVTHAQNLTRLSAAFTCELYRQGKLTLTVRPNKAQKNEPENPVSHVSDANTPFDVPSEITIQDLTQAA